MARDFGTILKEKNPITTPEPLDYGDQGKRRARSFSQVIAESTRGLDAMPMPTGGKVGQNGPTVAQRSAPDWRGHYLGKATIANSLYVHRPLKNAAQLHAWATAAGIPNLVPPEEMHVTQVYSRTPVDLAPRTDTVIAKRRIAPLGDKGAVVLHFDSPELQARHREAMAAGASHDFPSYQTHVTLSYDAGGTDLSAIAPPTFPLVFGPEVHAPLNENWAEEKGLRKDFNAALAKYNPNHYPAGSSVGGEFAPSEGGAVGQSISGAVDLENSTMDDLSDRAIYDNPVQHPALPKDQYFHPGGLAFASPSVSDKNLQGAVRDLAGARQAAFEQASQDVDKELGIFGVNHAGVVGAWSDGAENSTMTETLGRDRQALRLSAAMKGALGNQKAVLVFDSDPQGKSALYDMTIAGAPADVHERLLKAGIPFHTLVPQGNRTRVLVVDTDGAMGQDVGHFAVEYRTVAERTIGHAEFIGDAQGTGTDAEQRARAVAAYQQVIASSTSRYQGRDAAQVWQTVSDRWGQRLQAVKGRFFRALAKYNPNHVPAGSPEGGQFASGDGGIHVPGIHARDQHGAKTVKGKWIAASPLKTVDEVYAGSPANKQAMDAAGNEIAAETGTTYKGPGIKGRARVLQKDDLEKIAAGRTPAGVTDIVRSTFITPTPAAADNVVAALGRRFPITDEGWKLTDVGYFDRAVNVRFPNGQIGEVLLAPKELVDAKSPEIGGGHDLYVAWRAMSPGPEKDRLGEAQIQLYGAARASLPPVWRGVKFST